MLVELDAILGMDLFKLGAHFQTRQSLALAHRIAVAGSGEVGVVGTLEDEGGPSILTTGTDTTILEIAHQIARTDRAVDRLYDETGTFGMNESLTGEIVTIVDFQESTILT